MNFRSAPFILPRSLVCFLDGAFARLDQFGVEGLIHVSEIPQAEGKLLKEVLSDGQSI